MKYNLKTKTTCKKCKNESAVFMQSSNFSFIGYIFNVSWYKCNHCGFKFSNGYKIISKINNHPVEYSLK